MNPALMADAFGGLVNFGLQLENQAYNRNMQKKQWEREDTAIQRRIADLKAAGLSPVLAAGQGASSSTPIQTGVPQIELSAQDLLSAEKRLEQQKMDISRTTAETAAINAKSAPDRFWADVYEKASNLEADLNGSNVPVRDKLALQLIENSLNENRTLKANAEAAEAQAEAVKRQLNYDKAHGVYSSQARELSSISQLMLNNPKEVSGVVAGGVLQLLGKLLLK